MDYSKTTKLQEMTKERDRWYGAAQDRAIRINDLAKKLKAANEKIERFETAVYDLQMADSHLEFISRVQDAGLHHEWDEFMDALVHAEKHLNKEGSVPKDYESVQMEVATGEPDEFAIFYKGGQISMNEIVLRLNRLSEIESKLR